MSAITHSRPSSGGSFGNLTGVPDDNTALAAALAAKLNLTGGTLTGALAVTPGTLATTGLRLAQTWNSAGTTCRGMEVAITDTACASNSTLLRLLGGVAGTAERFAVDKDGGLLLNASSAAVIQRRSDINQILFHGQASSSVGVGTVYPGLNMGSATGIYFTNDIPASSPDILLHRAAASVMGLKALSSTTGSALELHEMTAPASPGTNRVRLYAEDNGSGKTRLMALFPSGASQQIAIEP